MQPSMQRAPNSTISVQELFTKIDKPVTPRSTFDRSFPVLTTLDANYLVPLYWDDVCPSDTIEFGLNMFGRVNTLINPIYDNLYLDVHAFFVPNRIIVGTWGQIMGDQPDPLTPVTKTVPQISFANAGGFTGVISHSLANYLGMPIGYVSASKTWTCLPFRAYKKIYDDLYRDENFVAQTLPVATINSEATQAYNETNFPLYKRFKRKDYFTSATPDAQKGDAVEINIGGNATIFHDSAYGSNVLGVADNSGTYRRLATSGSNLVTTATAENYAGRLFADLSTATGITISQFREFITLQQYLERDMRNGTRYTEYLYSAFGVQPEDARLQRAEYLFGKTFDLMVTPIAQSSESGAGTPQGTLTGVGTFSAQGNLGVKSFSEHGIFMVIASVRQEQRYQQGIARKFNRESRYDFYDPIFANLSEQAILCHEIFADGTSADLDAWGYQQAWAEMRYNPALVTGKMSSNDPASLDPWHLAQDFASLPALGQTFLEENVPMDRVVAVTSEPDFTLEGIINIMQTRPLPQRSVPGLLKL